MEKTFDNLNDYYQVRFEDEQGNVHYGVVLIYDEESEREFAQGNLIIQDATYNEFFTIPLENVTPFPCQFGGEYDQFVTVEYEKAVAISDAVEGLGVGKLFSTSVADGKAFYMVSEVSKKTVGLVWRSFQGDRYVDPQFGVGGIFPISKVKSYIQFADALKQIFGKK